MMALHLFPIALLVLTGVHAAHIPAHASAAHTSAASASSTYPFKQLVAFGDEFSDNGNGSYAHGITGSPANVYGFGTWTDGPVAVSYLTDLLGVPLRDLAFGGCCGGGSFGATLDNNYTTSPAQYDGKPVPSVRDQIYYNYTTSTNNIAHALHVIMAGQNDLTKHTDAFWEGDPQNTAFAQTFAANLTTYAEYLIEKGAPAVLVANLHPKQLAPVTKAYLCGNNTDCVTTLGNVIQAANSALATALEASPHASKIIYYDMYALFMEIINNKDAYGFTADLSAFCDGDGDAEWNACISGSYTWQGAEAFFWMNYEQPTTHVHRLMAADMKTTIDKFYGH